MTQTRRSRVKYGNLANGSRKAYGRIIRQARMDLWDAGEHITQQELADALDMSREYYRNLEKGLVGPVFGDRNDTLCRILRIDKRDLPRDAKCPSCGRGF